MTSSPSGTNTDATALVQLASTDEATHAIAALNGSVLPASGATGVMCVQYAGKAMVPSDNLYAKGLPLTTTESEAVAMFSQWGVVKRLKLMPPMGTNKDYTALVQMGDVDQ